MKRLFVLLITLSLISLPVAAADPPVKDTRDIVYKTTDEGALHLDLYYPEDRPKRATGYPLVVYTHGGGWVTGSRRAAGVGGMGQVVRGLTERGFCVASIEYRLWSQGGTTTIRDCVIDAKDALRFLVKNRETYAIDPDRVFSFGDSAGGQIAQMLLLSSPESLPGDETLAGQTYRMVAGVSWYGPCDFEKTELFNHDGRADFRDRFGPRILPPDSDPDDKLRLYREMSPVNYLAADSPPLLMIQGDQDTTIPVHHAHYMEERSEKTGAPVEILIVRNAGHNWRPIGGPLDPPAGTIIQRSIEFIADHPD